MRNSDMALSAPVLHDHPGTTDQEKDTCLGHDARQESAYVPLQRAGTVCASACVGTAVKGTIRQPRLCSEADLCGRCAAPVRDGARQRSMVHACKL